MEATYVNISELKLGKVVAEDIFANTQYPILLKNTKINQRLCLTLAIHRTMFC